MSVAIENEVVLMITPHRKQVMKLLSSIRAIIIGNNRKYRAREWDCLIIGLIVMLNSDAFVSYLNALLKRSICGLTHPFTN